MGVELQLSEGEVGESWVSCSAVKVVIFRETFGIEDQWGCSAELGCLLRFLGCGDQGCLVKKVRTMAYCVTKTLHINPGRFIL